MRVQPVDQLQIHPQPAERILRRMHMQIHQSGNDNLILIIVTRKGFVTLRQRLIDACAFAVPAYNIAVLYYAEFFPCPAIADISFYHIVSHYSRTSSWLLFLHICDDHSNQFFEGLRHTVRRLLHLFVIQFLL